VRAQFVLSEIGIGLRRNLTMTIAVVVTVAISLALFGSGLLIRAQVEAMKDFWYDKVEVSVYLCGESSQAPTCGGAAVTQQQRDEIQADLEAMPEVDTVFYESQEQAYAQFREQFEDSPDLVENVTAEALPESFRVKLEDPTQFAVVASAFAQRPGVEEVQDQKALLEGFFNVLNKLQLIALIIAGVQVVAAVLLISNTIRVAAFSRRRETGIMRLVGASNLYIQLPFLLEGVLAGLVGAGFAAGALVAVKAVLVDGQLRPNFPVIAFVGWNDVLAILPWLFLTGMLLAGLSSFVTLRRHLRV
jgi:cell division transport system permease protein